MPELSYALLRLLPKNTLSRAVGAACRASAPRPVVRAAIRAFARKYGVDASEAERPLDEYPTFTEFFTRRLKPGSRPIAPGEPGRRHRGRAGRHRRLASLPGEREALHAGGADRRAQRRRGRAAVRRRGVLHHLPRPVQLPPDPRPSGWRNRRIRQHARPALAGEPGWPPERGEAFLRERAADHVPPDLARSLRRGGGRRDQRGP